MPSDYSTATDGLPGSRRLLAILALSSGTALVVIDGAIATVALPTIARDLAVSGSAAVLVVTIYQLVIVMTLLPFAHLGDRLGLRRLYQAGQAAFTITTALCFFAHSLEMLLFVRVLQALGASAVLSVSPAMVREIYPARQPGRGLGLNTVIVQCSAALAPTIGGIVLVFGSWPWVFASAVPFALVSLTLGRALPAPAPHNAPFDIWGAALCAAMFGLITSGVESAVSLGRPAVTAGILAAGALVGILFVRRELRDSRPILPVDLLARPAIGLAAFGSFTAFTASMVLLVSLPFRLQHSFGFSPVEVGGAIAAWPLATMIAAPVAGALADRYPAGLIGGMGMILAGGALASFAWVPGTPHLADFVWRMAMCGTGFGMFISPNGRFVIGSAPRARAAAAGALVGTIRLFGQTMGASLAAALLAFGLGRSAAPAMVAMCLALVALGCSALSFGPRARSRRAIMSILGEEETALSGATGERAFRD